MKHTTHILGLALAILTSTTTGLRAQTGAEIMQTVYDLPSGETTQGQLTMTLLNKQGESRVRILNQYIQNKNGVEKKIMFFQSPADVKGTSFMNWSYDNGKEDDQWIYLPALKRIKRISSSGKGDSFMGSDFTYDDLGDRHPSLDNHKLLREESVSGTACYVVESTPKDEDYMYAKTVTWVMKENHLGLKREFYDEEGDLLKVLSIQNYDEVDGFWMILKTEMKNVQKNHSTVMEFSDVQINQGIPESRFTERSMSLGM